MKFSPDVCMIIDITITTLASMAVGSYRSLD